MIYPVTLVCVCVVACGCMRTYICGNVSRGFVPAHYPQPQLEEYDKSLEQVPMRELLKANAKEWPFILLGILGSIIQGSAFPVFAIVFGEILRVSLCGPSVLLWVLVCCAHTESTDSFAAGVYYG